MPEQKFLVAWTAPDAAGPDDQVLSFLPPRDEDVFTRWTKARVDSGRGLAHAWRQRAVDVFAGICARAGIAAGSNGRTLRAALQRRGECSDWWFHGISSKLLGPVDRTIFESVLAVLTIDGWAARHGAHTLHVSGASDVVIDALRSKYRVIAADVHEAPLLSRLQWRDALKERLWALAWSWATTKQAPAPAAVRLPRVDDDRRPVVALTGHPWLRWDRTSHRLIDSHFRRLPDALEARGFRVVRWLWYLTDRGPIDSPHIAGDAYAHGEAISLQTFIRRLEIVREMLSLRAARIYWRYTRRQSFRAVFRIDGVDLYPLFRVPLLRGFLGAQIPLARLGAIATARACEACKPFATVCHFEWTGEARPHNEGVRRSRHPVCSAAMQHSTNTSVLIYRVDPEIEFRGEPDGCAVPRAEHVFVTGRASGASFRAAGYAADRLSPTGSTRFDPATLREAVCASRRERLRDEHERPLRLLALPSSLKRDTDLIDAAIAAAEGVPGIDLYIRTKPGRTPRPGSSWARRFAGARFTDVPFAQDLAAADLILFSASGGAEEALACGVPVWQWLPIDLEGTTLTEVAAVPQFHSVAALRDALIEWRRHPDAFALCPRDAARALEQIFGPADGGEADRIAARLRALWECVEPGRSSQGVPA